MAQILLLWFPKNTGTAKSGGETGRSTVTGGRTSSVGKSGCLVRILRKVRKQSKEIASRRSRQSSFQCRYDPLSYSLNFDTSTADDEEYHHLYAFSSRFAANPRRPCSTNTLPVA